MQTKNKNKKTTTVFKDLGFSDTESSVLVTKSKLLQEILNIVEKNDYTQTELKEILKAPQPRISELLNGRISSTSIEKLLEYLDSLGAKTSFKVSYKKTA